LPAWVANPGGVAQREPAALRDLTVGLMMSGFAMQAACSSRPASGADHQFSHLWDMQDHTFQGEAPSHGFKVGIGTLASLELYRVLLDMDFSRVDIDAAVQAWPTSEALQAHIAALFAGDPPELLEKAVEETQAKVLTREALRDQLMQLQAAWPKLRQRLTEHLLPYRGARSMLREAGSPSRPEQIGISCERLRLSYEQAFTIRRRYTVLDFAKRFGVFESAMAELFGSSGPWAAEEGRS
jgi:glycerol-1-phosphate dehydrogenase [NAD(P)+]